MRWLRREPRLSVDEVVALEPYLVIGTPESDRALERRIDALPRRERDLIRRIRRSKADGRSHRIELRGGAAESRRIEWYELPETLLFGPPAPPGAAPDTGRTLAGYRRTDSILDDGAYVYTCEHPE